MLPINLLSSLIKVLQRDEPLSNHFDLGSYEDMSNRLENISEKEYRYILALIFNKKRFELNQKMVSLGFPRKEILENKFYSK